MLKFHSYHHEGTYWNSIFDSIVSVGTIFYPIDFLAVGTIFYLLNHLSKIRTVWIMERP